MEKHGLGGGSDMGSQGTSESVLVRSGRRVAGAINSPKG
jgi:hypothetical protein